MTRKDIAKSLLEDGMSAEKVAEKTKLSLEDVKNLYLSSARLCE